MRMTLRDLLRNCRVALKKFLNKRDKWVKEWAGQVSWGHTNGANGAVWWKDRLQSLTNRGFLFLLPGLALIPFIMESGLLTLGTYANLQGRLDIVAGFWKRLKLKKALCGYLKAGPENQLLYPLRW